MTTLYASIIRLHALHPGQIERDPGQWVNAAFYGLLRGVDPSLSAALHAWNGRKPFTVSSLLGMPRGAGAYLDVHAGWEGALRVTTLGQEIFQPFIQRFLQGGERPLLQIGPLPFGVSAVLTTPGSDPWAGYIDTAQLIAEAQPCRRLSLEFVSPTAFHVANLPGSGAHFALFPDPVLVFGAALARKWRDLIDPALDVDYVDDLAREVRVSDYRLETRTLKWKGRVQKGFTGRCTYDLQALSENDQHLFAVLADFAFYAGVGGKTTQGMGQCRLAEPGR